MLRNSKNPILTPQDIKPSAPNLKVDGVFNCGAVQYNGEILLLCRVSESAIHQYENKVLIPVVASKKNNDVLEIIEIDKSKNTQYDFSDSRSIRETDSTGLKKIVYLTSLSHFRIARSKDGINFTVSSRPSITPIHGYEDWGIEDPRITKIDDKYYITYTAVSPRGACVGLIETQDFENFKRLGIILPPENKDAVIFPQKINGYYYALQRPVPYSIGSPNMWLMRSKDLIYWGEHQYLLGVNSDISWMNGRIGGGAVPILTDKGWLIIYHAADKENRYCLCAMLLEKDNPANIVSKQIPIILAPEMPYEIEGFFGNVVFSCGAFLDGDNIIIYYGAADDKICRADVSLHHVLKMLD